MARTYEKDESGTEFAVETGFGVITKVEWPVEGKKNANVTFDAEGLKIPVKGWANTTDREDLRMAIASAFDNRARVAFRIEIHRAGDQPNDKPFCDVPDFSRFRRLEGLRVAGGVAERPIPNQPSAAPSPMPSGGTSTDTWAYAAAVGTVDLAYELLHDAVRDGRLEKVLPTQVKAMAVILLRAADNVQVAIRGKELDRNANSHTRARGAVRTALQFCPPPIGEVAKMAGWAAQVEKIAAVLLAQASELAEAIPSTADAVAVLEGSWARTQNTEN